MSANLQDPRFTDEAAARDALEAVVWPNGPVCPHCGNANPIKLAKLTTKSARPGLRYCNECKGQFTATVGTVFERSKIPLTKWWLAMHLIGSSKKGMSSHQLHRMLGISYKSTWFMMHRIREAMRSDDGHKETGGFGGPNEPVEVDETYVGGKARNRAHCDPPTKYAVLSLIERGGRVKSFHVANVTAEMVRPLIVTNVNRASVLMSDESRVYPKIGEEFSNHHTVNHSANEYARLGGYIHINSAENFYSILKRGITGVYHHVSEAHLHRYLAEFDFRYNNRSKLGIEDAERVTKIAAGITGKRLTYRPIDKAANA